MKKVLEGRLVGLAKEERDDDSVDNFNEIARHVREYVRRYGETQFISDFRFGYITLRRDRK